MGQELFNKFGHEIKPKKLERLSELDLMQIKHNLEMKKRVTDAANKLTHWWHYNAPSKRNRIDIPALVKRIRGV